jgi:hypothetical protein
MKEKYKSKLGAVLAISSIVVIALAIVVGSLYFLLGPPWQGIRQMEREFTRDKDVLVVVSDYLANSSHNDIIVRREMMEAGVFSTTNIGYIEVSDINVADALRNLRARGYSSIAKGANTISFVRWSNMDVGVGVVFSMDGSIPTESALPFLTEIEALTSDSWFFYVENFNEWRMQNRQNG